MYGKMKETEEERGWKKARMQSSVRVVKVLRNSVCREREITSGYTEEHLLLLL